jgi:hypothetical protein
MNFRGCGNESSGSVIACAAVTCGLTVHFFQGQPVPLKRVVHVVSSVRASRNSLLERRSASGEVSDVLERVCDEVAKERNLCTAGRTLAGSVIQLL